MTIHPQTYLGPVHLTVSDLDRSLNFYQQTLGFQVHRREEDTVYLGAGKADLVILVEQGGARRVTGTTGLYHFAILVPSRFELAQSLKHLAETQTLIQGFADHWVSEAIYLSDPDGHGIEIYRDRPRSKWPYSPNGQLKMGTDALDVNGLLGELTEDSPAWAGLHPETVMGHIHLHVGHLDQAEAFYREVLGFDLMLRYGPTASFLSAAGYHHHLGMNTWAGVGVLPPPGDAVRLLWYDIILPNDDALHQVVGRLDAADVPIEQIDTGIFFRDPAQVGVRLMVDQKFD